MIKYQRKILILETSGLIHPDSPACTYRINQVVFLSSLAKRTQSLGLRQAASALRMLCPGPDCPECQPGSSVLPDGTTASLTSSKGRGKEKMKGGERGWKAGKSNKGRNGKERWKRSNNEGTGQGGRRAAPAERRARGRARSPAWALSHMHVMFTKARGADFHSSRGECPLKCFPLVPSQLSRSFQAHSLVAKQMEYRPG